MGFASATSHVSSGLVTRTPNEQCRRKDLLVDTGLTGWKQSNEILGTPVSDTTAAFRLSLVPQNRCWNDHLSGVQKLYASFASPRLSCRTSIQLLPSFRAINDGHFFFMIEGYSGTSCSPCVPIEVNSLYAVAKHSGLLQLQCG